MRTGQHPEPPINAQHQPEALFSQLTSYAHDLKHALDRESHSAQELAAARTQLLTYARDLKRAYVAEKRKSRDLERAYTDTVLRLTRASRFKDEETGAHLQRLSHYAKTLALSLGLRAQESDLLFAAVPMHDVGKIGVPDHILRKPGPLDPKEWAFMKKHPALGASLMKGSPSPLLNMAGQIALTHHERWDGSGYPQGLHRDQIPLVGRMIMLVDVYDALRSQRSYKPAFSHSHSCDLILQGDGRTRPEHFDPRVLDAFRELHYEFAAIYERFRD